jgi:hypothetical protein
MSTRRADLFLKPDLLGPASIDTYFMPVNPYDFRRHTNYLYQKPTNRRDAQDLKKGDYIVQFVRYHSPTPSAKYQTTWRQPRNIGILMPPGRLNETESHAQFKVMYQRGTGQGARWGPIRPQPLNKEVNFKIIGPAPVVPATYNYDFYVQLAVTECCDIIVFDLGVYGPMITETKPPQAVMLDHAAALTLAPVKPPIPIVRVDNIEDIMEIAVISEQDPNAVRLLEGDHNRGYDDETVTLRSSFSSSGTIGKSSSTARSSVSSNISDQLDEGTCFAHTVTRLFLKAVRQAFKTSAIDNPLQDTVKTKGYNYCNGVFNTLMMANAFFHVGICDAIAQVLQGSSEPVESKSGNNFLLYTYVYKLITNHYGCSGAVSTEVVQYLVKHMFNPTMSSKKYIIKTLTKQAAGCHPKRVSFSRSVDMPFIERIASILERFSQIFRSSPSRKMINYYCEINGTRITSDARDIIAYVLKKGYYVGLHYKTGEMETVDADGHTSKRDLNHIVTIVDYESRDDNEFILVIKNSWGKTFVSDLHLKSRHEEGIIRSSRRHHHLTQAYLCFMLPSYENMIGQLKLNERNDISAKFDGTLVSVSPKADLPLSPRSTATTGSFVPSSASFSSSVTPHSESPYKVVVKRPFSARGSESTVTEKSSSSVVQTTKKRRQTASDKGVPRRRNWNGVTRRNTKSI